MIERTDGTEQQLAALASGADRANRPGLFVVVPALLLVGACLLALIAFVRFEDNRVGLRRELSQQALTERRLEEYRRLQEDVPDVAEMFPIRLALADRIEEIAENIVWAGESVPVQVPAATSRPLFANSDLARRDVVCSVSNASLAKLLEWVGLVEGDERVRGVFVAGVDLRPPQGRGGWSGTVTFRLYEAARN